jgi:glycosyltransferase involved in cell wall biosynthesis
MAHHDLDATPTVLDVRVVVGEGGGPDKTIALTARGLPQHGYRNVVAVLRHPADMGYQSIADRAHGIELVPIDDYGPFDVRVLSRLVALCRRERVSIWHGHEYKSNVLGWLVSQRWPMSLVSTAHGWVQQTRRTPIYYALDRAVLRRYDRVICVSGDILESCVTHGVNESRCVLLPNAVDSAVYTRRRSSRDAKELLHLSSERLLIGAVGRLSPEKRLDLIVRAVDEIIRSGSEVDLVIAGAGDEFGRLQSLIGELGQAGRIRVLGHQGDMVPLYEAMDIVVSASEREGLPNVLLEAMSMGTPVVATAIAGVPDLIDDGRTGLLVEASDLTGLRDRLRRLVESPELRARLARAARSKVVNDHNLDARIRRVADIYDEILSASALRAQRFS